jgi:cobalt-zinc-cadmium efflux system membrane fusion protein
MNRFLLSFCAFLAGAIVIVVALTMFHPHILPAWAQVGERRSPGDDHDHGDEGHEAGEEEAEGEHADEVTLAADAVEKYGIRIAPAARQLLLPTFVAPAKVAFNAESMAHVGTQITGRIIELRVNLGDEVKKGDPLLVIQSPEWGQSQSEYLQQLTAARTAAPSVDIARASYENIKRLYDETKGAALNEVRTREGELKVAEAALQAAESAVLAAESRLRQLGMEDEAIAALAASGKTDPRFTIYAPIEGQVVEREVTLGELVDPQQESLLVLADLSTLWILADVPEARGRDVAVGASVSVSSTSTDGPNLDGSVTFISPSLDQATRTLPVRIVVQNDGGTLRPGTFARAEIAVARPGNASEPVLAVPEAAIQTVEGRTAVFVAVEGEANTFAARPITAGKMVGGMVPVLSGLAEGEPVVVAGSFLLKADLGKSSAEHQH